MIPIEAGVPSAVEIQNFTTDVGSGSVDIIANILSSSAQSLVVATETLRRSLSAVSVGNYAYDTIHQTANISKGDGFLILADVIQEEFAPGTASSRYQRINARLTVNGTEVPIKSFQYQVPSGKLGSILNLTLAIPDKTQVPANADIDFSLIIQTASGEVVYPLVSNGKMQERDYKVAWSNQSPKDELTISAIDVIADKFGLSPRRPVVMFDPNRSDYSQTAQDAQNAIRDHATGRPIMPVIEPVPGLTMKQVLKRAYTGYGGLLMSYGLGWGSQLWAPQLVQAGTDQQGLGFTNVITNIPDYRVKRADFQIENGWHDGAQPVTAMYAPVYFVNGTVLYILDVERPLPYGISPRSVTLSQHKSLSERLAYKPDANSVLLTYQYDGNDPYEQGQRTSREVFVPGEWEENSVDTTVESETVEAVASRKAQTRTDRWVIEWYDTSDPTNVLASYDKRVVTETRQDIWWPIRDEEGEVTDTLITESRTTHRETIDYRYEKELRTGYVRTVEAAFAEDDVTRMSLRTVEREYCQITWTDEPDQPGVKVQDRVISDTYGLVYTDSESETMYETTGDIEIVRYFPVLLAQSSGIVDSEMALSANMVPMYSMRQKLRRIRGRQTDVESIEIDHLNNTLKRSYIEPTIGTPTTDPFESKSRTILIPDEESIAEIGFRVPVPVNAYELPRDKAIELGQRTLYRFKNPLMQMPMDLPGVDFAIDRGSVIRGQLRDGSYTANPFFVTGYSISGEGLGKPQEHRIRMSLEATELLPYSLFG